MIAILNCRSQDNAHKMWSVGTGYSSFKDDLATKLLYQGFDLHGKYASRCIDSVSEFEWSVLFSPRVEFSHDMVAIEVLFNPLNIGYMAEVVRDDWSLFIGPGISGNYYMYINPFLNSGHFYWYTHYDLELRLASYFNVNDEKIRTALNTSVLSLASRPDPLPAPYFYNWNFFDFIADAHSNMVVGSLNTVQHVELTLEWLSVFEGGNPTLSYVFTYDHYVPAPSLQILQHLVRITWY